jgi:dGTPase
MDSEIGEIMNELREFMFKNVYLREETNDQRMECKNIVETLVQYFLENKNELPKNYLLSENDIENSIDYVAGMTDRFAISTFEKIS